jgi:hypothetical protein
MTHDIPTSGLSLRLHRPGPGAAMKRALSFRTSACLSAGAAPFVSPKSDFQLLIAAAMKMEARA